MAKKSDKNKAKLNYSDEVKKLRAEGPRPLYLLHGPEDYLREQFLAQLKKVCLPDGEDSFSYRRFDGPGLDAIELAGAIDSIPFMTERSFIELRDVDINKLKEPESYIKSLSDIPDYCTVVFVQNSQYEPDGRMKLVKTLRDKGYEMRFTQQSQSLLFDWVGRRFAAAGKTVDLEAVQRLIFTSGDLMNKLIPEIDKISSYAKGERITVADVDAVAHRIPEADIFNMTDCISRREYNNAAEILSELLSSQTTKDGGPIFILATLSAQLRKLYAARLAIDEGLGAKYLTESCGVKMEFMANNFMRSARGFKLEQLADMIRICTEADYKIKSSSVEDTELLKEAVMKIAARAENA